MSTKERRVVHTLLRVGGAMAVVAVQRTPPAQRLGRAMVLGAWGVALAAMLDGSRGTAALLHGAEIALRQLT